MFDSTEDVRSQLKELNKFADDDWGTTADEYVRIGTKIETRKRKLAQSLTLIMNTQVRKKMGDGLLRPPDRPPPPAPLSSCLTPHELTYRLGLVIGSGVLLPGSRRGRRRHHHHHYHRCDGACLW